MKNFKRTLAFIVSLILVVSALAFLCGLQALTENPRFKNNSQIMSPSLKITVGTDKESYLLRQKVSIEGEITLDGTPASNLVVITQVKDPLDSPAVFRTLTIGSPTQTWPLNITNIFLLNYLRQPINTAKIGTQIQVGMTIENLQMNNRNTYATITVFDSNMVPLQTGCSIGTIGPLQTISQKFSIYIPPWACSGKSLICANVYSQEPITGGIALGLEKTAYFCISRAEEGLMNYPTLPPPPPQTTPGVYETSITQSPDPMAGTYNIYVLGQASPMSIISASTTFNVENSAGYPPQASFAFWPAHPYLNMTVNFDASSSTPEGFDDVITKYVWDFGDGKPKVVVTGSPPNPFVTHNYEQTGTFTVTLNVTDNEGLWSLTSKPITIYPEFGPTAIFSWAPSSPLKNQNVTFDASNSTTGWCAKTQRYSPIQTYKWNFSDGTGEFSISEPTIIHNFTQPGNYTVKLTVIDADGRSDLEWHIIEVQNITLKQYDITGDNRIDMADIYIVAKAWGSKPGDPNWNPIADINHDNRVDMADLYPMCKNFGKDP